MESEYTARVGIEHRKEFGQFFTPAPVSKFMAEWVLATDGGDIFDPAFGLGAFYDALPRKQHCRFRAMDIDAGIVHHWASATKATTDFIQVGDYLRSWGNKHRNIICNPPYMRFQKFMNRDAVCRDFEQKLGVRLSGYTNTASAFLLKSLSELEAGGRLAYIMPLEFLNTGYGKLIKERLLAQGHLAAIISLENEKEVFPDATTSVGILLVDSSAVYNSVRFYALNKISDLEGFSAIHPTSIVTYEQLDPAEKWLPFFSRQQFHVSSELTTPLNTYGRFSRGIATGANEFFALTRSRLHALELDETHDCVACLSKSAQVRGSFLEEADILELKAADKPVFLFSAETPLSPAAAAYIQAGESAGYDQRFLTKNRNPWFKTELRQPAPLLLGVFSRGGYKMIRNRSNALNLTCYHGFQPDLFGNNYIDQLFLYFCSNVGRRVTSLCARKYGDSLDKFEPNDINAAKVPTAEFFDHVFGNRLEEAMEIYRATQVIPEWLEEAFAPIQVCEVFDLRTVA